MSATEAYMRFLIGYCDRKCFASCALTRSGVSHEAHTPPGF